MAATAFRAAAVCICSLAATAALEAPVALTVDFSSVLRPDVWGVGGVRHGFDWMPEETDRGLNDTFRALSLQRIADARLRVARTWYGLDWAMPVWGGPLDFGTVRFEAFCRWVAAMQAANVTVALQAGWWFTEHTCGIGLPSTCTPDDASLAIYTAWVSASLRELVIRRGFTNIKILVVFTEPLGYASGLLPPGYTQETYYAHAAKALHAQLVADGVRDLVSLMGPNDGGLAGAPALQQLAFTVTNLDDVLDIYSSHDYSAPDYAGWLALFRAGTAITAPTGKPFLVDEGGMANEAYREWGGG